MAITTSPASSPLLKNTSNKTVPKIQREKSQLQGRQAEETPGRAERSREKPLGSWGHSKMQGPHLGGCCPSSSSPRGATQRDSSAFLLFQRLWNLSLLPFSCSCCVSTTYKPPRFDVLVHPHPSPSPAAAQGPSKAAESGGEVKQMFKYY